MLAMMTFVSLPSLHIPTLSGWRILRCIRQSRSAGIVKRFSEGSSLVRRFELLARAAQVAEHQQ